MDNPVTEPTTTSSTALPLPAIICIAIGGYIVVIVVALIIRQILMQRGICGPASCCGKEGEPCCTCCASCGETCNCCRSPNMTACLDAICPRRRNMTCADVIMCQCCSDPEGNCCGGAEPCCDCGQCNCNCQCQPPECTDVNCLCFTLAPKAPVPEDVDVGIYP